MFISLNVIVNSIVSVLFGLDYNYYLIYKNTKFAARVTAVDSWYIEKPFVYGSTSIVPSETGNGIIYFFIDVCNGQKYQTKNRLAFNRFLNNKNISKENRYWMSGDNALDIKQPEYSSKIDCAQYS